MASRPYSSSSPSLSAKCRSLETLLLEAFSSLRDAISADPSFNSTASNEAFRRLCELQRKLKWQLHAYGISNSNRYGDEIDARKLEHSWLEQDCSRRFMEDEAIEVQRWKQEAEKKEGEIWRLNATVEKLVRKKEVLEQKVRKLERKLQMMAVKGEGGEEKSRAMEGASSKGEEEEDEQRIWSCSNGGTHPAAGEREMLGQEDMAMGMVKKAAEKALQRTAELGMAIAEKMKEAAMESEMEAMVHGETETMAVVHWAAVAHKKLAVQGFVSKEMFCGFQHEDFYMSGALQSLLHPQRHRAQCWQQYKAMADIDPLPFLLAGDLPFGQFCRKKFLSIFGSTGGSFTPPSRRILLPEASSVSFRESDRRHPPPDPVSATPTSRRTLPDCSFSSFRDADRRQTPPDPGSVCTPCRKTLHDGSGASFRDAERRRPMPDSRSAAACRKILPKLLGGGAPVPEAEDLPRALADADVPFFGKFVRAAHAVWVFHRLAFAVGQAWRPAPFWAEKGAEFSAGEMRSAVEGVEMASDDECPTLQPCVAFTVMPGIRAGGQKLVVRCAVYLDRMRTAAPAPAEDDDDEGVHRV